jgi:uroporphyrinogen-III synthase
MRKTVVLVLRGRDAFSDKLVESGCEVINLELLKIEPVHVELGYDINDLDGLFFTSPHAANSFLSATGLALREYKGDIYVLGERTKNVFEGAGISVRYQSDANTAAEMIRLFGNAEFAGKKLLYVRGDRSLRTIPNQLVSKAQVSELIAYRTVDVPPDPLIASEIVGQLGRGEIDWMCFFSPSGVDGFLKNIDAAELCGVKTAAIGETTAGRLRETGLSVDFVSSRTGAEDFADELIEHINNLA